MNHSFFPFDLFTFNEQPGLIGAQLRALQTYSMFPPFPWGQWLYGRLLEQHRDHEGDFIELGVGMGGMSLFLALQARVYKRRMYCLDSFVGLPSGHVEFDNPVFRKGDFGPREDSQTSPWLERLQRGVDELELSKTVTIVPGFFEQTLTTLPRATKYAFMHVDCDLYDGVLLSLETLYDRVVDGGFIAIDDFFHPAQGAIRAATHFFNKRRIHPLYHVSFPYAVVVRKGEVAEITASHFAFDGNLYSLDYLRSDRVFCDALEQCRRRAIANEANLGAAENAGLLLSLLNNNGGAKESEIYGYWYALRDFWGAFYDHRVLRPVFTI